MLNNGVRQVLIDGVPYYGKAKQHWTVNEPPLAAKRPRWARFHRGRQISFICIDPQGMLD